MEKGKPRREQDDSVQNSVDNRKNWEEPKLIFVEPKLVAHGELVEVTGQFFGSFIP